MSPGVPGQAVGVPLVEEPVPAATARVLRAAVLELRARERRRLFAPVLHLGLPGPGRHRSYAARTGSELDVALRTDLVAALLRRTDPGRPALAWLTRPGELTWHDADATWLPPTSRAFAEAERPLTWVVVTRDGWWDPRSGAARRWQRLRPRSAAP